MFPSHYIETRNDVTSGAGSGAGAGAGSGAGSGFRINKFFECVVVRETVSNSYILLI